MRKRFPSSTPVCDTEKCFFSNDCKEIGKEDLLLNITLLDSAGRATMEIDWSEDDLFIDGELLDNGEPETCYLAIFNFGKLDVIDKKNKWVFGKRFLN